MTATESQPTPLAELLENFGVSAVMAVDDGDRDLTFDSELSAVKIERGETPLAEVLAVDGVEQLLADRDVDRGDESAVRELIADGLRGGEISLGPPASDVGTSSAFTILRNLLTEAGLSFDVIHFDDWAGPASVDPTTLVLFDFRHGADPQGVALASAYITMHGDAARVAILSQEPGEAHELWAEHVADVDAPTARQLVWIPKASLTTEPSAIVEQLAVALSAPLLRRVQSEGLDLLRSALEETAVAAETLNPYELHQLTVGSASDGGFEPESLINRFARRSLPVAVAEMQRRAPVHTAIRQLRTVGDANLVSSGATNKLIELQRDDYYVGRHLLVGRHQGAIAGDIFALVPSEVISAALSGTSETGDDPLQAAIGALADLSLCVLVGQPCDLAVRPSGERALRGRWLEALQISAATSDSAAGQMGPAVHNKQNIFRLPWLVGSGNDSHRRVNYKNVLSLPMLAVDACVWSAADAAALTAGESPSLRLSLNWQQRHALLSEELARIERACLLASTLEGNGDAAQDALVERMRLDAAASDDLVGFHFDAGARSMAWGLVRVARLRSPFIESLLTSYNDFRRRDAFPAALA